MAETNGVSKRSDIMTLLTSPQAKEQIKRALPKHLTADRFLRVAITARTKNPKLSSCTQESFFGCLMDCAQLGLEPDGRRAHLIPYGNVCTLIIDYKGLVELAMNTGEVSSIHADIVCTNDTFRYNRGMVEEHTIDFSRPRGEMYAAYCIITMKDGSHKSEVMTKDEIDAIRKRSKAGSNGPWVTDYNEMAKKTVFRRASKWIKLSPEVAATVEADYDTPDDIVPALTAGKPEVAPTISTEEADQVKE